MKHRKIRVSSVLHPDHRFAGKGAAALPAIGYCGLTISVAATRRKSHIKGLILSLLCIFAAMI